MRAVQITRFGGPEVMDIVDLPDPTPGPGQQLYEVSSAGAISPTPTTDGVLSKRSRLEVSAELLDRDWLVDQN